MDIKQKDIKFGLAEENNKLNIMKLYFNKNIKQQKYKYSKFDYFTNKYYYELKSRRIPHNKYNTTLIGCDKVIVGSSKKQRFVFNFTDGIYYITYKKDLFDTFETNYFNRTDRGCDIKKLYFFIPIDKLKKIS